MTSVSRETHLRAGRLDHAEAWLTGLQAAARVGRHDLPVWLRTSLVMLRWWQGRFEEAAAICAEGRPHPRADPCWRGRAVTARPGAPVP